HDSAHFLLQSLEHSKFLVVIVTDDAWIMVMVKTIITKNLKTVFICFPHHILLAGSNSLPFM
ncbi:hypothetical protein ACQP3L_38510, partial [Escherichia coli]